MTVAQRYGHGRRILVTGGAGFVPSHVVDRLIERGATVVAVDNFVTGSKENVAHLAGEPRFTLVEADVSDGLPAHEPALAQPLKAVRRSSRLIGSAAQQMTAAGLHYAGRFQNLFAAFDRTRTTAKDDVVAAHRHSINFDDSVFGLGLAAYEFIGL